MHVVSVINYKGGVGKTTITANLGAELARRGSTVLLIDLDPQASLTFSFYDPDEWRRDLRDGQTIKRWFDGLRDGVPSVGLGDLVVSPRPVNGVIGDDAGRLDLIASHLALINVDLELARGLGPAVDHDAHEAELFRVRGALAEGMHAEPLSAYDIVLIDCPPNFNVVTQAAIIASDLMLIPAKADYLSTLGIEYLYGNVQDLVKRYNADARKYARSRRHHKVAPDTAGVVFTMIQLRSNSPISAHQTFIDQVRALGLPVFATAVRENITAFANNSPRGVPVVLRERVSSPVGDELRSFAAEFDAILHPERAAA